MKESLSTVSESLQENFPFWTSLTEMEQVTLLNQVVQVPVDKGTNIYNNNEAFQGVFIIFRGALRSYIITDEGRDITLYRLSQSDVGSLSSDNMLHEVVFKLNIEAEEDCLFFLIPSKVFLALCEKNLQVKLFSCQLTISRYSEIMWTLQQVLFTSFDKRLASFLIDESVRTGQDTISLTHEKIASYIGSAREVVTRMLKYFSSEKLIETSRASIRILDRKALRRISQK